ncbi:MAG: penicillin-binding protein 2 [bacterium]|nr:penicillin-binding protein 2 [bacterium]
MTGLTGDSEFGSPQRLRIMHWIVLAMAVVFIGRLAFLQIIQGNVYRLKAEAQAIKQIKVEPFRGNMIDRNGRYIVQNAPGFSVTVTPYELTESSRKHLAKILGVSDSVLAKDIRAAEKYNKFAAAKISSGRDVGYDIISAIEEQRDSLAGVDIIVDPKRMYTFDGNAAHLLGYTREVDEKALGLLGDMYDPGDLTGQTGLERAYESNIRGQKGLQFVAVNKSGQRVASFNDGKSDVPATEGNDIYLGLDIDLQELAEKLMEGKRGGAVALDPNNGEILAFVSKPDFDLRNFSGKTSRKYSNQLLLDPEKPLFNRVSAPTYSPGSTWKPLVALAGLQEGVITEKSTLYCAGGFTFGNRFWKCHGGVHGALNVRQAIQVSCNAFFNQVALKLGVERHHYYAELMGFGQYVGVDIGEEKKGLNPSREYLDKNMGKGQWTDYVLLNWGIGQGEVTVTPLQIAAYTATIGNEGTWYQPHAVRSMNNKVLKKRLNVAYGSRRLPVDQQYFRIVKQGMRDVVTSGTARGVDIPGLNVCGKTGTAEVRGHKDQSWFIAFAPMDNPKIAICVSVEAGGFGATTAAPIVRKMLELFFNRTWPTDIPRDSTWIKQPGVVTHSPLSRPDTIPQQKGPFWKSSATVSPRIAAKKYQ